MVGDVSGLSLVGSCLCQFKISTLGYVCHALSMSYFLYLPLWCQHDVWSALNIWAVIVILFSEEYRVAQKNVYTLAAVRWLWQCLDADGGHFRHLHWIQNSRTSLIWILLLYKYSSYDYRVIFFMSKCVYIFLGHSVHVRTEDRWLKELGERMWVRLWWK